MIFELSNIYMLRERESSVLLWYRRVANIREYDKELRFRNLGLNFEENDREFVVSFFIDRKIKGCLCLDLADPSQGTIIIYNFYNGNVAEEYVETGEMWERQEIWGTIRAESIHLLRSISILLFLHEKERVIQKLILESRKEFEIPFGKGFYLNGETASLITHNTKLPDEEVQTRLINDLVLMTIGNQQTNIGKNALTKAVFDLGNFYCSHGEGYFRHLLETEDTPFTSRPMHVIIRDYFEVNELWSDFVTEYDKKVMEYRWLFPLEPRPEYPSYP